MIVQTYSFHRKVHKSLKCGPKFYIIDVPNHAIKPNSASAVRLRVFWLKCRCILSLCACVCVSVSQIRARCYKELRFRAGESYPGVYRQP